AAALANAAREQIDYLSRKIIKDAQRKNITAIKGEIEAKQTFLRQMEDSIRTLRDTFRIYDLVTQQEVLSTELAGLEQRTAATEAKILAYQKSRVRGARDSIQKLEITLSGLNQARVNLDSQLQRLNRGMGPLLSMRESRGELSRNLNDEAERLKQYQAALRSTQPTIALLEEAQPPVIKSRPKRSFIVVGATFFTFLFAVLAALLVEQGKRYRWEEILD
ncbi:MAG: hypothetical protein AAFU03_08770, partial [Bacteroidota bacterium]